MWTSPGHSEYSEKAGLPHPMLHLARFRSFN